MLITHASPFCSAPTPIADWAVTEFGHAQLGDDRRTDRLLMIATAFAQQPTAPIPQACGPGSATQGAYRFFENDDIEPEAIREAHEQATLERVRLHAVVLAAPTRQSAQAPLTVWAIEAREARPPKGASPILWRLLTTLPVNSVEQACEKVGWYAQRWQIEVIHKVLKSGCQIQQRQLESAARLERALAIDQVVAWRVLALCKAAREEPDAAVSAWLGRAEWEALWCHVHQRILPPPSPLTLWRGLHRLNDLTAMWRLCHGKIPK